MLPPWIDQMRHGPTPRTKCLWAPLSFWNTLDDHFRNPIEYPDPHWCPSGTNGCGSNCFDVSEYIFGLQMTVTCNIHDWMWGLSDVNVEDKENERRYSNRVFFNNQLSWIHCESHWLLRYARRERAWLRLKGVDLGNAIRSRRGCA